MFRYLNKRGQSTLEYGVVIAVIVAGLIAMQTYVKRGFQGRLRQASDDLGEQFSPGITTATRSSSVELVSEETVTGGDKPTTTSAINQSQTSNVVENVAEMDKEYWGKK